MTHSGPSARRLPAPTHSAGCFSPGSARTPCPALFGVECGLPTAMGRRLSSAPWSSRHRLAHRWASGVGTGPLGSRLSVAIALEVSLPTQAAELCHVPSSPGVHCDHRWRRLPDAALRRGRDCAAPSPQGPLPRRGCVSEALCPHRLSGVLGGTWACSPVPDVCTGSRLRSGAVPHVVFPRTADGASLRYHGVRLSAVHTSLGFLHLELSAEDISSIPQSLFSVVPSLAPPSFLPPAPALDLIREPTSVPRFADLDILCQWGDAPGVFCDWLPGLTPFTCLRGILVARPHSSLC